MASVFRSGRMYSEQIYAALASAVFSEDVKDGSICKLGDLVADTTYATTGDYEYDVYEAAAPTAVTDEVCIVDYAGISEGQINGVSYKIGNKLFDLTVPEGTYTRVRRLHLHDKFWLGEDNFYSEPTVGEYAELKANSYKHDPKTTLTGSQYGIKILLKKGLTTGNISNGYIYLCEVVAL